MTRIPPAADPKAHQRPRPQVRTLQAQRRFLRAFAQWGNVLKSAQAAGVGRRTVYVWLDEARFKTLYDEAHDDALDALEEEGRRRAVDGVLTPVFQHGRQVGHVREYSDTLLNHAPEGQATGHVPRAPRGHGEGRPAPPDPGDGRADERRGD